MEASGPDRMVLEHLVEVAEENMERRDQNLAIRTANEVMSRIKT
jgi:hypothetical protein